MNFSKHIFPFNCTRLWGLHPHGSIRFFQRVNKGSKEYASYKFFKVKNIKGEATWMRYPISRNPRWRLGRLRREVSPSRLNVVSVREGLRGKLKLYPINLYEFLRWLLSHPQDIPRSIWWKELQRNYRNP